MTTRPGRPVVAVTAYEADASFGAWNRTCSLLPVAYVRALEAAGAAVALLPVQDGALAAPLLARVDGLVLTGGPDVAAARYGAPPHPETQTPRLARDAFEVAALEAAEAAALPVLAICRGMQLLNVVRGGTLHQHLPELVGHDDHAPIPGGYGDHQVVVEQGTKLHAALGWEKDGVPTHHHQAVDTVGEGLAVVARADDGTIEAVEDEGAGFVVGVQWHPEAGDDPAIFTAFVAAAEAARAS